MSLSKLRFITVTAALLVLSASAEQKGNESCRTAKCHTAMSSYPFLHDPLPDCDTCHKVKDESKHKFDLVSEVKTLCMDCHPDVLEGKPLEHSAVESCTDCHNPHGSGHPRFLKEAGGKLCAPCHEEIVPAIEKAKIAHLPARWNCLTCHDPHGSKEAPYLKAPVKTLCESCHSGQRSKDHPKTTLSCTNCHAPHDAEFADLLKKAPAKPVKAGAP